MPDSSAPVDKAASVPQTEPKGVTGVDVDPAARVLVLKARGPLDVTDTIVHLSYAMLKSLAGQMMHQEGMIEATELLAARKVGIVRPDGVPH